MNRIFNLIWSKTKEKWIVVSEKVKGNGKVPSSPLRSLAALTALFMGGVRAYALEPGSLPTEGQITAGTGTITTSGTQMTVNQSSQQLIANWGTFNIGENAGVRFNQPTSSAAALNRIFDQNPSQIMGSISSNGQVFLLNPSGIIFGKTARVDVGGLVASSLNMLDSDFLAGKYTFTGTGSSGAVLNKGVINTVNGGVVALMAPNVTNEGSITANSGSILVAAGNKVSLDFTGDGLISYTVDQGAVDALVENKGLIKADGGLVVMTARAADVLHMATATNTGVIEAHTIQNKAGRILLLSDMENGQTNVGGTLDASAHNSGDGGFIETSAGRVKISDGTIVTTLASKGKSGTWLIDPTNFTISSGSGSPTVSGIGAATLETALGAGDVSIATSDTENGTDLGDINVDAGVFWSLHTLTLTAHHDININAVMTAGATDDSGTSGTFAILDLEPGSGKVNMGFNPDGTFKGRVDFFKADGTTARSGTGFLTINTHPYTVITTLGAYNSSTHVDLQGINGGLSGYYALGSNIDASPTAAWNSDGASTPTYAGFTPIGSSDTPFTGTFDGLGHIINQLTINRPALSSVGLFGNSSGAIRNVGLVNASVAGSKYGDPSSPLEVAVGGLVGVNSGTITNSYATGNVSGDAVGGLVGLNAGSINNSYSTSSVTGSSVTGSKYGIGGGLVGVNFGAVTNSYSTGNVSGDAVGGLVGVNIGGDHYGIGSNNNTISNSYATGSVTGSGVTGSKYGVGGGLVGVNIGAITNSYATGSVTEAVYGGGLVGINQGTITSSYAMGNVSGHAVGGLVGNNIGSSDNTISKSYATGNVTGDRNVGGLVGENGGSIENSYATGSVTGDRNVGGLVGDNFGSLTDSYSTGSVTGSGYNVGGLVGYNGGTITNSFYNITTSAIKVGDGEGETLDAAVTPYGIYGDQFNDWLSDSGKTSKTLDVTNYFDSSGGYYLISYISTSLTDKGNLQNILGFVNDANSFKFKLENDIVLPAGFWIPLFNAAELAGAGYKFTGLSVNQPMNDDIGLVGLLGQDSTIKNLGVTGLGVTGNEYVGGLVGDNFGSLTDSYSTGSVTGSDNHVGGLVGYNGGTITNSFYNITTSAIKVGDGEGETLDAAVTPYGIYDVQFNDWLSSTGKTSKTLDVTNYFDSSGGYYLITNISTSLTDKGNLQNILGFVNDANSFKFKLENDIVLPAGFWIPLFNSAELDGAGYKFTGLSVNQPMNDDIGMIGLMGHTSTIKNLGASDVDVTGKDYVGGLVGDNYGTVSNSYATGKVTGSDYVGGLVGYSYGSISNSYATGSVTGTGDNVGGLAGLLHHLGTISNSYAEGSVTGTGDNVGGLVGSNWSGGTIRNSYATGRVEGVSYVGGLVGDNHGTIEKSYAGGGVTGSSYVGGLVGNNYGTIEKSYATGSVEGGSYVGGLVGNNYGTIEKSYARGSVTGRGSNVGALVGYEYGDATLSNSFYEKDANPLLTGVDDGTPDVAGEVWGLSTARMKLLSNFMEATAANGNVNPGWDFTPGTGDWKIDAATNGGYPYLAWQTSEKPYERPPLLSEPLPGTPSYPVVPIAPPAPLIPEGQLLEAKIVNPPSGSAPGLILVIVPQSLGSEGSVFSFVLPDEVKSSAGGIVESVTLLDGGPLPSWLYYNPETMTFTATDMPQGVTELKVLVTLGGKSWIVDITMQQAP
jgi:filamentous hemagglutinin family protein